MNKKIFYLAVIGWGTALLVHSLALVGVDVIFFAPYVWLLHIGIFAVWIPAVLRMRRARAQQQELVAAGEQASSFGEFKQAPRWLTAVASAGMVYAFVNFMLVATSAKSTGEENGHYYTHIHGHDHQAITAQEYHRLQANDLRGFSGHWIGFYGMAMAMLYPFKKPEELEEQQSVAVD